MKRLVLAFAFVFAGCHESAPVRRPVRETSASMNPATLPATPVHGTVAGRPFTLRTAWMRVVRRVGQERVDLVLSEGRPGRLCGQPTPRDARQIVVRFTGVTALPAETVRIDVSTPRREVFGEAPGAHGIEGLGSGSALVVVERSSPAEAAGRLRVCLPDAHQSCVDGSFRAEVCWDELNLDGPRGARDAPADGGAR